MQLTEAEWSNLLEYRDGDYDSYFEHHGVKGMRWGVRKDRESGGGRKSSKAKDMNGIRQRMREVLSKREQEANQKKLKKAVEKAEKAEAKAAKKREDILRSPTKLYKNRYNYSQDEINNALRRFEWEKKLRDYSNAELEAGKKYIDTAFQYANSAINLYNQAARVVNSFNLSDKPWTYVEQPGKGKDKKG